MDKMPEQRFAVGEFPPQGNPTALDCGVVSTGSGIISDTKTTKQELGRLPSTPQHSRV